MEELPVVALGALLHDIGKVIQRADADPMKQSHSKFGALFLQSAGLVEQNKYWQWVIESIQNHHWKDIKQGNASLPIAWFVFEADNLASAHDRKRCPELFDSDGNRIEETDSHQKSKWNRYRHLDSVFHLFNGKSTEQDYGAKLPLWFRRLTGEVFDRDVYPYPSKDPQSDPVVCYQTLRDVVLKRLVDFMKGADPTSIDTVNSILRYLEESLSMVPPDTYEQNTNDVSLFDHLKLSAAIASCMYSYVAEKRPDWLLSDPVKIPWNREFRKEPAYLLVKSDLSGIQDFIYNVSSRAALKGLRGRSFYLELLQTQLAEHLLKAAELSQCNLIYQGGGGFALLLPNTKKSRALIDQCRTRFNEWLLKIHRGRLYLALDYAEVTGAQIVGGHGVDDNNMTAVWRELSRKLAISKSERFKGSLDELFELVEHVAECSICHRDDSPLAQQHSLKSLQGYDVCQGCVELISIGAKLSDADYKQGRKADRLLLRKGDSELSIGAQWEESLQSFISCTYSIGPEETAEPSFILHNFHPFEQPKLYWSLHKYEDNEFGAMAEAASGVKRIAILRADVDNLGKIFSASDGALGLPLELRSLSRDAAASRALARFFTHYLDNLLSDYDSAGRNSDWAISTVYSGGDDVFLAGAWDQVIQFAFLLHDKFAAYTQNKLTISAGISIHKPKYPLYKMAAEAARAEATAKRGSKDSLCIAFDERIQHSTPSHCFDWGTWSRTVRPLQQQIAELKLDGALSSGFWNYLLAHVRDENSSFYHLLYTTARLEERLGHLRSNEQWQAFKKNWIVKLGGGTAAQEQKRILETALNWVILQSREGRPDRRALASSTKA